MSGAVLPKFERLNFGEIDAALEAAEMPALLRDGYYDYNQAVQRVLNGRTWLILGSKGSGKSAVLEHIRLRWEGRWDRFFAPWELAGFPVGNVQTIWSEQTGASSRSQAAWEFLLLLRVLDSLTRDNGLTRGSTFDTVVGRLRNEGFLGNDMMSAVGAWTTTSVRIDAKLFSVERAPVSRELSAYEVNERIRSLIRDCRSESRHLVALDGLDSFFFEQDDEWSSLAGLMQACFATNRFLMNCEVLASVVIAARSDILDVLPGPEINKLKTHSVYLDWHAYGIGAQNHLWQLLTNKAAVAHPEVKSVLGQYLKRDVKIGPHSDMAEYLLDHTRLLPRDAVALMRHLQRNYGGNGRVPESNAQTAVRKYCEEYFVGEIFDNLAGVLPARRARSLSAFKDALRTSPSRFFTYQFVCDETAGELASSEVKLLLRQMFEVGGIGIRNGGHTDFVFRRTAGGGFSVRGEFILHDALTRAWNRPWR
ncbi:hypothetical protein [Cellulosimicrobium sp. 4261]|uniref:P-loop ATPase, Sll1717 family n=1 Tax=Cellulosimicrobium sp. 4261 TaxID=3156458 RepID=UPI003390850F